MFEILFAKPKHFHNIADKQSKSYRTGFVPEAQHYSFRKKRKRTPGAFVLLDKRQMYFHHAVGEEIIQICYQLALIPWF